VMHRLQCVGWQGNPQFDQRVFAELHEATSGIPRRINQVMSRLLLLGAVEQRTRIDSAMLSSVRKEMEGDAAFPMAAPQPLPRREAAPAPGPIKHAFAPPPARPAQIEALLEARDAQIAELQQAVVELSEAAPKAERTGEWSARIEALEARLSEQDAAVRQVLTMLIEWFEGETPRAAA
jgi:general secretion pathway protein A